MNIITDAFSPIKRRISNYYSNLKSRMTKVTAKQKALPLLKILCLLLLPNANLHSGKNMTSI